MNENTPQPAIWYPDINIRPASTKKKTNAKAYEQPSYLIDKEKREKQTYNNKKQLETLNSNSELDRTQQISGPGYELKRAQKKSKIRNNKKVLRNIEISIPCVTPGLSRD